MMFALNTFAFFILLIIYMNGRKIKHLFFAHKIFMNIVELNLIMLVVDLLARIFDHNHSVISYYLNNFFNVLLFILTLLPAVYWLVYVDFQIYHSKTRMKRIRFVSLLVILVNSFLAIGSIKNNWFFHINIANVYHRGPYFFIHAILCYVFMLKAYIMLFKNKNKIEPKFFKSLTLFPLPQLVGSLVQMFSYDISLNWTCMVISVLLVYFDIQDVGLNTDYLTGLFNRRQLDNYLKEKFDSAIQNKSFSAVMLDMDQFKSINDTYGHVAGDRVLKTTAEILRKCISPNDFIARLGGDEFFIVSNLSKKRQLEEMTENIYEAINTYNKSGQESFKIGVSLGYVIYDSSKHPDISAFMKDADQKMYQTKAQRRKVYEF